MNITESLSVFEHRWLQGRLNNNQALSTCCERVLNGEKSHPQSPSPAIGTQGMVKTRGISGSTSANGCLAAGKCRPLFACHAIISQTLNPELSHVVLLRVACVRGAWSGFNFPRLLELICIYKESSSTYMYEICSAWKSLEYILTCVRHRMSFF